ncbi:biosynthetic arginine decarboxylase [Candidatus Albibeggiatoa sp. nov. BB20]|uniref:biosynthetic arginine decarboxylase n=1 Tax=Candidatus Albibeggiatoa sp. nov. BB20 TaxID=3162723 RepID=UPI0033658BB8
MTTNLWDIQQSRALYNIEYWSSGYFDINPQGEICVTPIPNQASVSLYQLSQDLVNQGFSFPILVRFSNILHHRVQSLCQAFENAMQIEEYQANYSAIYPIKVNQNYQVVTEILNSGQKNTGLEAGSKAELMAVIGLSAKQGLVICNGYKDREYIRLALIGQQMGLRPYIVIEKASELKLIIEESQDMEIKPLLGIRVRLATIGSGKWQNSGGEKAKFGLSSSQINAVIEQLRQADLLDCLQLMHFHLGSQVANVRDIQRGLTEAARYYAEFYQLGIPIKIVDVGGGLGVDYDGTRSRSHCSINYSMQEYANNVVHELYNVCQAYDLPQPDIISESGRAMTAHHAVLLTNVIDVEHVPQRAELIEAPSDDDPQILQDLRYGLENLNQRSVLEVYHDAVYLLTEAYSMFTHGLLNLNQRAQAEQLYYAICWKVKNLLQANLRGHRNILDELNDKLVDKYFCNFSLFQSTPDAWAIDQLFPIIPIHRLQEKPANRAKLQDLTCDSDGQFTHYVDGEGVESSLPVHEVKENEDYLLGIFLVGAYQEVLGDIHNLFGDTYSVSVQIDDAGHYTLVEPHEGDRVENMLRYVNIDPSLLRHEYRKRIHASTLTYAQKQTYLRELDSGLMGYTYLEG